MFVSARVYISILLSCCLFFSSDLSAQTRMEFRGARTWTGAIEDFWIIETMYAGAEPIRVYLQAELLSNSGEKQLSVKSQIISLPPGRKNFGLGSINSLRHYSPSEFEFQDGNYLLCISLHIDQSDRVLANTCSNLNVVLTQQIDRSDKAFEFGGNIRLYGQLVKQNKHL